MFIRTPIYSSREGAKESEVQDLIDKILAAERARDLDPTSFSAGEDDGGRVEDKEKEIKDKITAFLEKKAESEKVARDKERDGYLVKILKYVPIELSSIFAGLVALAVATNQIDSQTNEVDPLLSLFDLDITPVKGIFLLGAVLTPLYFYLGASKIEKIEDRPTWWFYLLSPLAFTIWAMAINNDTRRALDRGEHTAELLLALGALLIPAVDEFCVMIFGDKKKKEEQATLVDKLNAIGRARGSFAGLSGILDRFKRNDLGKEPQKVTSDPTAMNNGTDVQKTLAGSHTKRQ